MYVSQWTQTNHFWNGREEIMLQLKVCFQFLYKKGRKMYEG